MAQDLGFRRAPLFKLSTIASLLLGSTFLFSQVQKKSSTPHSSTPHATTSSSHKHEQLPTSTAQAPPLAKTSAANNQRQLASIEKNSTPKHAATPHSTPPPASLQQAHSDREAGSFKYQAPKKTSGNLGGTRNAPRSAVAPATHHLP